MDPAARAVAWQVLTGSLRRRVPGEVAPQAEPHHAALDILDVYRVLPWIGPYLRGGVRTAFLPSYLHLSDPTEVIEVAEDGVPLGTFGTREGRFRLSNPFAPVEVKGGVSLSVFTQTSYVLDANFRVSFGGRALFNQGLLTPVGLNPRGRYQLFRRANAYQIRLLSKSGGDLSERGGARGRAVLTSSMNSRWGLRLGSNAVTRSRMAWTRFSESISSSPIKK